MKTAGIVALTAAACMLVACTTDQPETPPETSESDYEVAARGTPPEPGETIHHATIEATLDGQPITIIGFTKGCYRNVNGNEVTIAGETQGYGYNNNRNNNINTGVGVGNFARYTSADCAMSPPPSTGSTSPKPPVPTQPTVSPSPRTSKATATPEQPPQQSNPQTPTPSPAAHPTPSTPRTLKRSPRKQRAYNHRFQPNDAHPKDHNTHPPSCLRHRLRTDVVTHCLHHQRR